MGNRKIATILAGSAIIFLIGCTSFNIGESGSSEEGSSNKKVINKKNPLENLTAENITSVNIDSRTEDDSEEDIRIEIDFVEGTICSGKAYEFRDDNDELPEVKSLTDEQLTELRGLVKDYSYTVQGQEKDYWPDLEEYPPLLVLFEYEIEFGEGRYATDGALCYPDGWGEFVDKLLEYGSAQDGGATQTSETGDSDGGLLDCITTIR